MSLMHGSNSKSAGLTERCEAATERHIPAFHREIGLDETQYATFNNILGAGQPYDAFARHHNLRRLYSSVHEYHEQPMVRVERLQSR